MGALSITAGFLIAWMILEGFAQLNSTMDKFLKFLDAMSLLCGLFAHVNQLCLYEVLRLFTFRENFEVYRSDKLAVVDSKKIGDGKKLLLYYCSMVHLLKATGYAQVGCLL